MGDRGRTGVAAKVAVVLVVLLSAACGDEPSDESVKWALTAEPDGATVPVRAEFGGSSCTEFHEWQIQESATKVEVQAFVRFSGAGDCSADLVTEPYTVRLTAPLGDRRLTGCDPENAQADCTTVTP